MNYIYNQIFIYKRGLVGQSRIFASTTIFEWYDIERYLRQDMNSMTIDRIELVGEHLKKMTPNSDLQFINKESGNSMTTAK